VTVLLIVIEALLNPALIDLLKGWLIR